MDNFLDSFSPLSRHSSKKVTSIKQQENKGLLLWVSDVMKITCCNVEVVSLTMLLITYVSILLNTLAAKL